MSNFVQKGLSDQNKHDTSQQNPPPEGPRESARAKRDAAFLKQLTYSKNWARQQLFIIQNKETYEEIICALTKSSTITNRHHSNPDCHEETGFVTTGIKFAWVTHTSFKNQKRQQSFSNFQFLILISYVAFLEKKGFPNVEIHRIIQSFSRYSESRRIKLLAQARKINSAIRKISQVQNWDIYRATELFFVCKFCGSICCDMAN